MPENKFAGNVHSTAAKLNQVVLWKPLSGAVFVIGLCAELAVSHLAMKEIQQIKPDCN